MAQLHHKKYTDLFRYSPYRVNRVYSCKYYWLKLNIFKELASPKSVFEYQRQDKLFVTGRTVEKADTVQRNVDQIATYNYKYIKFFFS